VNTCVVHKPEPESLLALDVIAARYANSVRKGLGDARPLTITSLASARLQAAFRRKPADLQALRNRLNECEAVFSRADATDTNHDLRMAAVYVTNLRKLIARVERGEKMDPPEELQGFRIGPVAMLAAPFEVFQAIKNDVKAKGLFPITLVMSLTNAMRGYAPDRTLAARGGYAADTVPMIVGELPFTAIHDELVAGLTALAGKLGRD
jgi:hypothetical protein